MQGSSQKELLGFIPAHMQLLVCVSLAWRDGNQSVIGLCKQRVRHRLQVFHRRLAKSNIEKQYFSHCVNDVCNGSPSRILRVRLISFGITILPRSSTRRTMPVAFIVSSPLKRVKARFLPVAVFAGKGELCMGRWEKRKGTLGEIAALDSNNRCRFCIIMPMHCLLP